MNKNPYQPPIDVNEQRSESSIRYRSFGGKSFAFSFTTAQHRNSIRDLALQAINQEIGSKNVVSVHKSVEAFGGFTVTVWYRG